MIQWFIDHSTLIFAVLFGIDQALAQIPGIESNSVFQLIYNILKVLSGRGGNSNP